MYVILVFLVALFQEIKRKCDFISTLHLPLCIKKLFAHQVINVKIISIISHILFHSKSSKYGAFTFIVHLHLTECDSGPYMENAELDHDSLKGRGHYSFYVTTLLSLVPRAGLMTG